MALFISDVLGGAALIELFTIIVSLLF